MMETCKKEDPVFLERGSRATRGKRMTKLLNDEVEEDELFWNQDALKEEENDEIYEEEAEAADEFDSDFDEDEPETDEEVENDVDDRIKTKKRLIFPGKSVTKKEKKKKVLSKLETEPQDERTSEQGTLPEHQNVPDDLEGERIVRKSTRTSVIVRQAERDAIRAALQATMKPIKRKKEGEEKRMTQEEMLLEAAQTEIINLRNLERVLAREEEVKKRAIVHKAVYSGPQTRYFSKNGYSYIEFSKGLSFQSQISTTSSPYPGKALCAVTGLPAKYRDPKTGLPYATKEAFRIIRERSLNENRRVEREKDMGILFDSISGQGFLSRRKRSVITNRTEAPHTQFFARFRRTPALEDEDSD
ncbi:SWR1 complex subunit 2 isoform X2 [Malania oleifera]|uniref:SWR1 complex subunit 2 isoform X2 n=1 Tax=Malania oleifera TaxID=397392 RepID=UPI0025AE9214|nr:SWR1 complex subunit 2 isoform X2 [Malania oleifera]XP_057969086.1 SWR1 complex subunit 2 isoform X2 [Malania oleifera]XP_057969087.1 SWR1 complex subunit 2 isoform X2 [Malania oleifera]